jgi:hypothetical protein
LTITGEPRLVRGSFVVRQCASVQFSMLKVQRRGAVLGRSRIIFYLLGLLLIMMALRPKRSWENLQQLYTYRRGLVITISTLLLIYLAFGIWQLIRLGVWW